MEDMINSIIGEVKLSVREENEFVWKDFIGEEKDLTDKEKKYWEVRR